MSDKSKMNMRSQVVRAIRAAYANGQEDEALEPIVTYDSKGKSLGRMADGDYVIFYDIRGEREVQLTESLIEKDFSQFPVKKNNLMNFVTMIEYNSSLNVKVAFPPEGRIKNTLAEVLSKQGIRFCKISESEKAVHVGYFMNGKNEELFPGEERIVVPSPEGIDSYAEKPEMSASGVTKKIASKLKDPSCSLVIANLANVDVVGHIEDRAAVINAVEAVDGEIGKIIANCRRNRATLLVTADHGTVEEWLYPDGQINTGHTRNAVPFVLADFSVKKSKNRILCLKGELADVAPTILALMGLDKPDEMTAKSLLEENDEQYNPADKILLLILDGWGLRSEKKGNLIAEARTPNFDSLWSSFPHARLKASGETVGMPEHTVGNSESGHLHLGAGRRILMDRVRIDNAIEDGTFFKNESFLWAIKGAIQQNKALHLLGIVSHYSSHGTIKHLFALLKLAAKFGLKDVFVHALIGRRGEKPESGAVYIAKVEDMCRLFKVGEVVTVIGRFWALDREGNWDRIEKTYRAFVYGEGAKVEK